MKLRPTLFPHSLSVKLFAIISIVFIAFSLIYTSFYSRMQTELFEHTIQQNSLRNGELIRRALHRAMLDNDRTRIDELISGIGTGSGVERIRLYDKSGEIKFSSTESEVGHQVDMDSEACFACHKVDKPFETLPADRKWRIFHEGAGRVMGLIVPIRNAAECSGAPCHDHEPDVKILGVLDVQMSLVEVDSTLSEATRDVSAALIVLFLVNILVIGVVMYFTIYRPVHALKLGTEKLAEGDMTYRISLNREDELGILSASFNQMAESLHKAYLALRDSSRRLEVRVKEKTEELEAIHKEILQVERTASLGKMAATVAHELNNPLSGIVNYAKLLHKKVGRLNGEFPEKEKVLRDLDLIGSEAMRCGNIVRNLLIFARGSRVNYQPSSLQAVIERALSLVDHHLKLAGVQTEVFTDDSIKEVVCDPEQMMQVLVALFMNAIEAMEKGGTLTVRLRHSEIPGNIQLVVSDTGSGIPEHIKDRIFEPFVSTKTNQAGVGLGLAVVYGIVKNHKGNIRIESLPGAGSDFCIDLPTNLSEGNGHEG